MPKPVINLYWGWDPYLTVHMLCKLMIFILEDHKSVCSIHLLPIFSDTRLDYVFATGYWYMKFQSSFKLIRNVKQKFVWVSTLNNTSVIVVIRLYGDINNSSSSWGWECLKMQPGIVNTSHIYTTFIHYCWIYTAAVHWSHYF